MYQSMDNYDGAKLQTILDSHTNPGINTEALFDDIENLINELLEFASTEGYETGYISGYEDGKEEGYDSGYESGYDDGYNEGTTDTESYFDETE